MKEKEILKRSGGITLIALVITIIVLLILAGVTIATLTGDNGLLTKAGSAKNTANEAEIGEKIRLAYQDYYLGQHTQSGYTFQNALDKMFGANVAEATGPDSNGVYTVSVSGKTYTFNPSTKEVKIATLSWIENADGSFTKGSMTIRIGDSVNYNELSNGTKNYTTDTDKGICGSWGSKNSTTKKYSLNSSTYYTEDLSWKILGVNEQGQIELISENPTNEKVGLANNEGFLYGADELNVMCDTLYGKGTGAEGARNLNFNDIDKFAGIKTDNDKIELNNHYNKYRKYKFTSDGYYYSDSEDGISNWSDWITGPSYVSSLKLTNSDTIISKNNPGETEAIKDTKYNYNINQKISDNILQLLCGSEKNQWLATTYVSTNNSAPQYENYNIGKYNYGTGYAINSFLLYNAANGNDCGAFKFFLRPVITLKSDIKLSGSSSEGWTLQQ